jgi:hypothetical protein
MAIGKISGPMLQTNLARQGVDLSVDTNLVQFDVTNRRVGVNTTSPTQALDVNGNVRLGNISIVGNTITSDTGKIDLGAPANVVLAGGTQYDVLFTDGAGNLSFANLNIISGLDAFSGNSIYLGTPTDLSLTANAAYDGWTTTTKVTDAIDNLNQVALNLGQGTFVGNAQFTANSLAGASPKTIVFTGTTSGNPNTFYWDFGDGNIYTSGGSTITHTYSNVLGGLFTVYYRASNSAGTWGGNATLGAIGSVDDFTRTNYITLYTPNPIPSFSSNVTSLNTGNAVLLTDSSQYETDYSVYWGDGSTTVSSTSGGTQVHTYTNTSGDSTYNIVLQANSTTAGPSNVSVNSAATTTKVYSTHTPAITANVPYVINWEANGGGILQLTNATATNPGNAAVFGAQQVYQYWWNDTTSNSNVAIGSGGATTGSYQNQTLNHTYTMTALQQATGANVTYDSQLRVFNGHTASPFSSSNVSVTVVPSVRSNISATAVTVSDKTGDTALSGYIYTDYNGNNRALFTYNTAAQNSTIYNWGFGDGTASGNITTGAGTTSANITYTYANTGTKTANLTVHGNPGSISQSNSKSLTITINSNPAAPTALSGKTLSMSSASQYTNAPLIAANAVDNTSGNIASAGTSVTRYTSTTPLVMNTVTQANTSVTGTVTAYINSSNAGGVGFSTSSSGAQTNANLYVTADADARSAISAATYPTGFYKVFSAYVSSALTNFGLGYNDIHLEHTAAGKTVNSIGFVKDDVTSVPTLVTSGVTVSNVAQSGVTIRTVSGIPYYQSGGNIRITGLQAYNWIGQTYTSATPMSIAANATVAEGTTGTLVSTQTKTYAQLDGATTYLSSGIPKANTGNVISNTYTFGNIFVSVNGTAAAVGNISATLTSVNGASTAVSLPSLINVYSSAYTGFDETGIVCHAGAAAGNTTVAKRVVISSANISTPIYANTGTNYYSSAAFTSTSTVAATTEAVVRWGNLRVNTTNYSTGYLPVGPDLSAGGNRTTTQSFKFAFQRPIMQNMKVVFTGRVAGMYIAAPGTKLTDTNSTLNGWMDANVAYAGSGFPGANTGAGGNGSTGCAVGTTVPTSTFVSNVAYVLTLGSGDLSQSTATGGYNQCLFNVVLGPNDFVSNVYLGSY